MANLILLNKPYGVLSQFTDSQAERQTLADYVPIPDVYPAGRLDRDSEGLLLLTDSGALQHRIASPTNKMPKTYWVQLEGEIDDSALAALAQGVVLKDGLTRPATALLMDAPNVWPRVPPVRERRNQPTSWISITITEGRNRQVRRMTAAVGYPTLRLIRYRIGDWTIEGINPGQYQQQAVHLPEPATGTKARTAPSRKKPPRTARPSHSSTNKRNRKQ